ncbi:MAG: esterase, partial [Oscillospiraceae bacterium]|nr:esterase [Oscillospiraceae bacterium]
LSLGDREEKTRNAVMASVGDCIRRGYHMLSEQGVDTILEWNQGNHFREPDIRTAKAFSWMLSGTKERV